MNLDCQAIREASLDAKSFFIDYRVTALLIGVTVVNLVLNYIQKRVITRFIAFSHHSADTHEEIAIRFLQLLFGSIVAIGGYSMLIFNAASGCNASEFYAFYCGGFLLVSTDFYEFVRRWPLRAPVLGHHIMVFFVALAILEYHLLPAEKDDEFPWSTTLLLSNIGMMWISDFFHVIFRFSTSLPLIKNARKLYLVASSNRIFTLGLFVYGAIEAYLVGSVVGSIPMSLMAVAYAYNSYKAISFVIRFDCKKYYKNHQAKWEISKRDPYINNSIILCDTDVDDAEFQDIEEDCSD